MDLINTSNFVACKPAIRCPARFKITLLSPVERNNIEFVYVNIPFRASFPFCLILGRESKLNSRHHTSNFCLITKIKD